MAPSIATSADSWVESAQVKRAVEALQKHAQVTRLQAKATAPILQNLLTASSGSNSDDDDANQDGDFYFLVVAQKRIPEKTKSGPISLPLAYSMRPAGEPLEVCLITKDPHKEFEQLLADKKANSLVTKILGVSTIRKEYKPYEAKRKLCDSYDVFLADERVLPVLPKVLGKNFIAKKKLPIPVNLKKVDLVKELRSALDTTQFYPAQAASFTIKVAKAGQPADHVVANVQSVLSAVLKHIPGGQENIRSICLKTRDSLALPVYNSLSDCTTGVAAQNEETAHPAAKEKVSETIDEDAATTTTTATTSVGKTSAKKDKRKRMQQAREESRQEVQAFMKDLMKKIRVK